MMASGWLCVGLAQAGFGVERGPDLVPFEPQHPGKRLGHALVVVHDEDFGATRVGIAAPDTWLIVTDAVVYRR